MKRRNADNFLVGLVTIGALIIMVAAFVIFKDFGFWRNAWSLEVEFRNAGGLNTGAPVYLSGVRVGQVATISLDNGKAIARLAISKGTDIRNNAHFGISSMGPMGEKCLEIYYTGDPSSEIIDPGKRIKGESPFLAVEVLDEARVLLKDIGESASSLRQIIGMDAGGKDIRELLSHGKSAFATAEEAVKDMRDAAGIVKDRAGDAGDVLVAVLTSLRDDIENNRERLSKLLEDVEATAGAARSSLEGKDEEIAAVISRMSSLTARVDGIMASFAGEDDSPGEDLRDFISRLKKSGENLEVLSSEARKLISDDDVRKEVKNATRQVSTIANRVDDIFTTVNRTAFKFDYTLRFEDENSLFQSDIHMNVGPADSHEMFRMGIEDIGGDNAIDLQTLSRRGSLGRRAGIISSKVGVGVDFYVTEGIIYSIDLVDTRKPYMNFSTKYRVNRNFELMFSLRKLFREQSFNVGVIQHF